MTYIIFGRTDYSKRENGNRNSDPGLNCCQKSYQIAVMIAETDIDANRSHVICGNRSCAGIYISKELLQDAKAQAHLLGNRFHKVNSR